MNGVRRFLSGGLAGPSSQQDIAATSTPTVSPLSVKPSWPPSTPPSQAASPIIAQELSESPTPGPSITTAGLVLRRDKQLPPQSATDDDPSNSSFQSSRPSSAATSFTTSPSRSQSIVQASPSSRTLPHRATQVSRKSVEIYNTPDRASGLLNIRDELLLSLLASEAVVDSRGFEILSSEQVEDLKKEHQVLSSRLAAITKKLTLETKIRDAALSLSKVNSPYKSVSKQTSEQLDTANRKVDLVQKELWKISERANDINRKLLEHRTAVLSFSVRSMEKKHMADHGPPNLNSSELLSGTNTLTRNGNSSSSISPTLKFEHFFAGHAESVIPQTSKKTLSVTEVAALEEKLQAVTQSLNAANRKQAEMARDLSLLKLEKDQVETSMGMELHTAEETIDALEMEISNLANLDAQFRALQEEKHAWEDDRAELEDRRQEVEILERRLEVLEERSGEATEMERLLEQKDEEIVLIQEAWEKDKSSVEGAAAQLDEAFATLRTLIQKHSIMLTSRNRNSGSSLLGLVESIAVYLDNVGEARINLEKEVRGGVDERESLVHALEEARTIQEGSQQDVRFLEAQAREQSDRIAELVASQSSLSLPPVEYTGDVGGITEALMPIWAVLPSAEARGAKLGQSRFRSQTSNAGAGSPLRPSLSEMDVRSLKALYDTKSGQPGPASSGFTVEAFVARVQALINDDRALIERLLRFAQAHDLLKKNAERAQKLALDSNVALETYQKQVKMLEDRDITVSAKHAAMLEEVRNLRESLDRSESERRDLETQAAEQAETCRQLTDANNTLSAKTLGLAEEAASATDAVRRQLETQLAECKASLHRARDEIETMQNFEQTQRVALLEELNMTQTENSNLRAQLRKK